MPARSKSQKIGSLGHKWLMAAVEEHDEWLARDLSEDFGVDMEFELADPELSGAILKIQVKSSSVVTSKNGHVKFQIDRKYIAYASSCRYPVIFVLVDIKTKDAWYLWLQDWLLTHRHVESPLWKSKTAWTEWVSEQQKLSSGLSRELKSIAKWEGSTQLALSLLDALHSAVAIGRHEVIQLLIDTICKFSDQLGQVAVNAVIDRVVGFGDRIRGTAEGDNISTLLFSLLRRLGSRVSASSIFTVVMRGDCYSRTGLMALAILYDEFPDHIRSLGLQQLFSLYSQPIAFYCAFREENPGKRDLAIPPGFTRFGLVFDPSDRFFDNYMNRGTSAILDHTRQADGVNSSSSSWE